MRLNVILAITSKTVIKSSILYIGAYYLCLWIFILYGYDSKILSNIFALVGSGMAVFFVWITVCRTEGAIKYFWGIIMAAIFAYFAGDLFWAISEVVLGSDVPFPSLADVFYLSFAAISIISLIYIILKLKINGSGFIIFINICILMTVIFVISWNYILSPVIAESAQSWLGQTITIAYPISDLGILFIALTLPLIKTKVSFNIYRLMAGFLLMAFADTMYFFQINWSNYISGSFIDPLWPAALLIIASAGYGTDSQKYEQLRKFILKKLNILRLRDKIDILIPLFAMVFLIQAMSSWDSFSLVMMGYSLVSILLILRHSIALNENKRLNFELSEINLALEDNRKDLENTYKSLVSSYIETEEQSKKDYLTGAYNRRYLNEIKSRLDKQIISESIGFSVLVVDIDRFKTINDLYGHNFGDEVLKTISSIIQQCVRQDEVLGRYGGDEFIVFLPGSRLKEAREIAERIRKNIAKQEIKTNEFSIFCTLSIGIAEWDDKYKNIDDLIKKADEALYLAKAKGRDRCELYIG
jgi:diguanylate cyclase (GGDEF)-like protein